MVPTETAPAEPLEPDWLPWDLAPMHDFALYFGDELMAFPSVVSVARTLEALRLRKAGYSDQDIAHALTPPRPGLASAPAELMGQGVRMLAFGFTNEGVLWHEINHGAGSYNLFVDDMADTRPEKLDEMGCSGCHVMNAEFWTVRDKHSKRQFLGSPQMLVRSVIDRARADLLEPEFDVILVRGPPGASGEDPGRMMSIATAAALAAPEAHVFIASVDRLVDREWTKYYFPSQDGDVTLLDKGAFPRPPPDPDSPLAKAEWSPAQVRALLGPRSETVKAFLDKSRRRGEEAVARHLRGETTLPIIPGPNDNLIQRGDWVVVEIIDNLKHVRRRFPGDPGMEHEPLA